MKKYIICLLLLIVTPTISIAEDKEFALEIKDTKMDFIKNRDILTVYVVGKFVNKQQYPIKDIVIESQFFDKKGRGDAVSSRGVSVRADALFDDAKDACFR